jgi:hypothetical protein
MMTIVLLVIASLGAGIGFLVLVSNLRSTTERADDEVGSESWRTVNAEVVSVLRAGNRTFLRVRYPVGTQLIENDVMYPLPQTPDVGRRVPIRYDPAAPARAAFDRGHTSGTPPTPAERSARRPVNRKPLTRA